jgi:beta-lactamase class C
MKKWLNIILLFLMIFSCMVNASYNIKHFQLTHTVNKTIRPLLQEYDIPGIAVAITIEGKHYFYNFGLASKETGTPVTQNTLFELGSISTTFTTTLASYADVSGTLSLTDNINQHFPHLTGSRFDNISLLNLGTYTASGLPLQFPAVIDSPQKMMSFYKSWHPDYPVGTYRQYSNPSIALLGYLTAQNMNGDYDTLVEKYIFAALGLQHTYFTVPDTEIKHYATGYSNHNIPIRDNSGPLAIQTYSLKSNAEDMIKYVDANIIKGRKNSIIQDAIQATHKGYYKVGSMIQGLGWELYVYPMTLKQLLVGNSAQMDYEAMKVLELTPPLSSHENTFINKTGSTEGFGAYIAFIPEKKIGIVLMANKNYPIYSRVKAAYRILNSLEKTDLHTTMQPAPP